ncbi:MAG: transposase [Rickettsia endosymbiont of Cimex lectularius]|jgi:hypothetical protein|nr:MAG: transposase [Rickettsia endosymbiont of Cimex lectularius]
MLKWIEKELEYVDLGDEHLNEINKGILCWK